MQLQCHGPDEAHYAINGSGFWRVLGLGRPCAVGNHRRVERQWPQPETSVSGRNPRGRPRQNVVDRDISSWACYFSPCLIVPVDGTLPGEAGLAREFRSAVRGLQRHRVLSPLRPARPGIESPWGLPSAASNWGFSSMPRHPVAVIAPHPDDESLGCGGTIKHLTLSDVPVDVIFLTRGEMGLAAAAEATRGTKRIAGRRSQRRGNCRVQGAGGAQRPVSGRRRQPRGRRPGNPQVTGRGPRPGAVSPGVLPGPGRKPSRPSSGASVHATALARNAMTVDLWLYEVWTPLEAQYLCADRRYDRL